MAIYEHNIPPMYTDFYGMASPSELARLIIGDTVWQLHHDGIPRMRLWEECGGAWMVDKFRFSQQKNVNICEDISISLSPRAEKGVRIYYKAEVYRKDELVATAELSFMAVSFTERTIMRLRDIEHMWITPAQKGENMPKAKCKLPMEQVLIEKVRYSDCDSNQHLSSPKYIDFICDAIDYWKNGQTLFELLQVDYVGECRADSKLIISRADDGNMTYVSGAHEDGTVAFNSMCIYRSV